jgi:hypothetical protein
VCPKRFPCPWYIRRKPCTYLAPRLKQSPNRSKWPSTWSTSPRSAINYFQNDFWAYGTFSVGRAPILHRDWWHLHMDQNKIPLDPCHIGVPSVASKWFMSLWYVQHKPCTYLQMDRNELSFDQCHQKVPPGVPEKISMPMVHLAQTVHLSCI